MFILIATLAALVFGGILLRFLARSLIDYGNTTAADCIGKIGADVLGNARDLVRQNQGEISKIISSFSGGSEFAEILRGDPMRRLLEKALPGYVMDLLYDDVSTATAKVGGAYVLTDDHDHPFQVTNMITAISHEVTGGKEREYDKAAAIYEWIERHIIYGRDKLERTIQYRTAPEVLETQEGVCGEMAILYVVMARCASLESNFVVVDVDCDGRKVNHACASVRTDGTVRLVDPAYHRFDVKHIRYRIMPDSEAVSMLETIRRNLRKAGE